MNDDGFCRLCWRNSVGSRPHGKGPSVLEANRHGQQLFVVDLFRQKRPPRPGPVADVPHRHRYPVAHEQLTLVDVPRVIVAPDAVPDPLDPDFARVLDLAVRDHARAHGWSKTRVVATRQGLRMLAGMQDTPGAAIRASEVERLDPAAFNRLPIIDVLASVGLFVDDRVPPIVPWFERQCSQLPETMSDEVRVWFDVMLNGSTAAPRSRPRAEVTVRLRIRSAIPALSAWSVEGRTSLREITRDDIERVLPSQTGDRSLTVQALKSLFRTLKARRLVFAEPTVRTRTGRPEPRFPLPIDDARFRSALDSDDPARAVIAALVGFHALRNAELRGLCLTDVRDGRLHLGGRAILMARPVRDRLGGWLEYRRSVWPETANPHLLVNWQTAVRTTAVSHSWINGRLGLPAQAVREDRILHEAAATGDIRLLCDLFGLSVKGAQRYVDAVADHPSF